MAKKIGLFLLAFLLMFCFVSCDAPQPIGITPNSSTQTPPSTPLPTAVLETSPPYKTMNAGCSQKLLGNCVFINIFLTDGDSSFREEEKQQLMNIMEKIDNRLSQEIEKYNKEVSFIYNLEDLSIDYTVDYTIGTSDYTIASVPGHDNWDYDIIEDICSTYDIDAIKKKYNADNISFLLNIHKDSRSYAFSRRYFRLSKYFNEFAVVFTDLSTEKHYIHEILHLFGAIDLYDLDDDRLILAEEYFPTDIMLVLYPFENKPIISDLTAYLIGWADHLDEKYQIFLEEYKIE